MNDSKPWYASRTIWAALVAIGSSLWMLTGHTIAPDTARPKY